MKKNTNMRIQGNGVVSTSSKEILKARFPKPPPSRYICDACGTIDGPDKHTSWLCRFFIWLDSRGKSNE